MTIAFVAVLIAIVVGFIRADRMIVRAEDSRVRHVLLEDAVAVEGFLRDQRMGLERFRGMFDGIERVRLAPQRARALFSDSLLAPLELDSVALVDVRRREWLVIAGDSVWVRSGTDGDDATGASGPLRLAADGSRRLRLLHADDSTVIAIMQPISVPATEGGAVIGFAEAHRLVPAILVTDVGLDSVLQSGSTSGGGSGGGGADSTMVRLIAGDDTVLTVPDEPGSAARAAIASRSLAVATGVPWRIEILRMPRTRSGRMAIWIAGVSAIMALVFMLVQTRARVRRMTDRSIELEHLSTELLRANRAKSEFLANVSHELRTPLNAIVGFVDLLRDGVYGELAPRQVGPVERIEASATHLRHLVDQILDLAKMAAGRLEVHPETIEIRPFVLEVASEIEPLLTDKGLSFSLAVAAGMPKVRVDPTHLRQILVNLLGNAAKFTEKGGISVRARLADATALDRVERVRPMSIDVMTGRAGRHQGPWVTLQVIDSGAGVPRKDWERVFDEFEQVNAGPRGDSIHRGTGLGLSISRRLARLMGGDLTLESEEGRGSVFTVWLPAASAPPARSD
ncbi:MAG TPA: HAMP domain-containing sensor histidine kinase [Gemmatimonadaceae bacterium]|nr:HAMP domain-containing sensor histidine kinase [Gemmatimonadaceae bacterium]